MGLDFFSQMVLVVFEVMTIPLIYRAWHIVRCSESELDDFRREFENSGVSLPLALVDSSLERRCRRVVIILVLNLGTVLVVAKYGKAIPELSWMLLLLLAVEMAVIYGGSIFNESTYSMDLYQARKLMNKSFQRRDA